MGLGTLAIVKQAVAQLGNSLFHQMSNRLLDKL